GSDVAGTAPLANAVGGVIVEQAASGNTVGGVNAGEGNTIAFNGGDGVTVIGSAGGATGNGILQNSIFSNAGLGIALLSGGNGSQSAPVITSVVTGAGTTTIAGTLGSSTFNAQYRIEVFDSPACDGSGNGE